MGSDTVRCSMRPAIIHLISTIFFTYIFLGVIGMLLIFILSAFFNSIFSIPEAQNLKAITIIIILSIRTLFLGLPLSLFKGVLFGKQKIYMINLVGIASLIFYFFAARWVLVNDYGIIMLAWANLSQFLLESLLCMAFCFILISNLKIAWKLTDFSFIKEIISFTTMQFVANVSSLLVLKTDPLIIQLFLSLTFVSIYSIPMKIITYLYMLIKQFTNVLAPTIAHLSAKKDNVGIKSLFLTSSKLALSLASIILIVGVIFAKDFITLWVGIEFEAGSSVFIILLFAMWINVTQFVSSQVLAMSGHHRVLTKIFLIATILNIVGSCTLIYPLGINGVAISTLIAALFSAYLSYNQVKNIYHVLWQDWLQKVVYPALVPAMCQGLVTLMIKNYYQPNQIIDIFFLSIPGICFYLVLFWSLYLSYFEKSEFKSKVLGYVRHS